MKHPAVFLAASALVAGLFWNLGSGVNLILIHFFFPVLWGIGVAFWIVGASFVRRCVAFIITLLAAEALRIVMYSITSGWWYITSDAETQGVITLSLIVQLIAGMAALVITHFVRRAV